MRVVYMSDDGRLCIVIPVPEALEEFGIDAIAKQAVPAGKPYKIMDARDFPSDRSQRDNWTIDAKDLTDGSGAESEKLQAIHKRDIAITRAPGLIKVRGRV